MRNYQFYVYILTDKRNAKLYVGVTNNLERRTREHAQYDKSHFASRYGINKLVYYEEFQYINDAIRREKKLKKWKRIWKIDLVTSLNPTWKELYIP
jgi:putative endonuclease